MLKLLFFILFNFIILPVLFAQQVNYTVKSGDTLYSIASKHEMSLEDLLKINKIKSQDKYKLKVGDKLKVEPNIIFTLAYDKESKSYAMMRIEKTKTDTNSNLANDTLLLNEKEALIAKDNITENKEQVITTRVDTLSYDYYTAVKGDTLYGIAFKHDMKVSDFLLLNEIKDSSKYNLQAGSKLKVKKVVEERVSDNKTASTATKDSTPPTVKKVEKIDYYTAVKGDTLYGIAFKHDMKVSDFLLLNEIKDSSKYNLQAGSKLKVKKVVEERVSDNKTASTATKDSTTSAVKKVEKIDYYTAAKGDTLYGIAFKHDMKVSDFLLLNEIKDSSKYNLQAGSKLKVKKVVEERVSDNKTASTATKDSTTSAVKEFKENVENGTKNERVIESYTAKNGDTLSEIAEHFGMDMIDLYVLNKLDNKYVLKVGDKLYVFSRVATDYNTKKYTVKSGDTLYSIARSNNMSLNELLYINSIDIKKYTLQAGKQLKVYKKESVATVKVNNQQDIKNRLAGNENAQNTAKERPDITLSWPHKGSIIATYGVGKDKIANRGINIAGSSGDKVSAAEDGIVEYVGTIRGFGNVVIIKHENEYTTSYAHLSSTTIKSGDLVKKGEKIGSVGSSGITDKNELYFKVSYRGMPLNPLLVLPKS